MTCNVSCLRLVYKESLRVPCKLFCMYLTRYFTQNFVKKLTFKNFLVSKKGGRGWFVGRVLSFQRSNRKKQSST